MITLVCLFYITTFVVLLLLLLLDSVSPKGRKGISPRCVRILWVIYFCFLRKLVSFFWGMAEEAVDSLAYFWHMGQYINYFSPIGKNFFYWKYGLPDGSLKEDNSKWNYGFISLSIHKKVVSNIFRMFFLSSNRHTFLNILRSIF